MERLRRFERQWKRVPAVIRKPLVLLLGTFTVTLGLILIPLPGPGWLVVFAGFALLATEFAAAQKLRDWTWKRLKKLLDMAKLDLEKNKPKNGDNSVKHKH